MSWIDRLDNTELEITTGDGKIYKPLWLNAIKNVNYNTEGFDFVGIDGTYVSRKEQSGDQFPITLYFTGEDCIDDANAFQESSKDQRPWEVKHPFFDNVLAQPLNLSFDYSDYNIVKVTGTLWRTITAKFPEDEIVVSDTVITVKAEMDADLVAYSVVAIPDPSTGLLGPFGRVITAISKAFEVLARTQDEAKKLKDLVRTASGAIQNVANNLTAFTNSLIELINFPFLILANIEGSINGFFGAFNSLVEIFDPEDEEQQIFAEISLTALNSAAAAQFVNPNKATTSSTETVVDYQTRQEVANAVEALTTLNDALVAYYDTNGYVQNAGLALSLDTIINIARANLFDIAFQAKQERSVFIEKNSDPINLAYKYFGAGDNALDQFLLANNLTLEEHFEIKKGRQITYYV